MREPRTVAPMDECECPVEGHMPGCPNDLLVQVCPGCYAVGPERCAPGCIDDEIARIREDDDLATDDDDECGMLGEDDRG